MKHLIILTILALSTSALAEEYPISYWCGPPEKFVTLERYKEIKEAGFTIAMPGCSSASAETNKKILDYCQQVGLKAIVMDSRVSSSLSEDAKKAIDAMVADYSKHPALYGYFITDEPNASAFKGLGDVVAYFKERDPSHISFINLMPNYATPDQLASPSYEDHLEKYVALVKPPFISYDHYTFFDTIDRRGFYENLKQVRDAAQAHDLPFWNIVLCTAHGIYRNLTEGELRYEAMHTLAHGAKGLLWFTYWSPHDVDQTTKWTHAMIDEKGNRDPHYEMIKTINAEVQAIGSQLMTAKSLGATSNIDVVDFGMTVGLFKDSDGKKLGLFASQDYEKAAKMHALVHADGKQIHQFDPKTREWKPAKVDRVRHGQSDVPLDLSPGGAVLLRW